MAHDIRQTAWQFNETVSLLREARAYVPDGHRLAEEIDEGMPDIMDALRAAAEAVND